MPNRIKPKTSTTANAIPLAADLVIGEIATNVADGVLFIKKSDNTIASIGNATGVNWTNPVNIGVGDLVYASPQASVNDDINVGGSFNFTGSAVTTYYQVLFPSTATQLRAGIVSMGRNTLVGAGSASLGGVTRNVFVSVDGGFNWKTLRAGIQQAFTNMAANNGSMMLIASTAGVSSAIVSNNYCNSLTTITLPSFPALSVAISASGVAIYIPLNSIGATGVVYRSGTGVLGTFTSVNTSAVLQRALIKASGETFICGQGSNGGANNTNFSRSSDGGLNWATLTLPSPGSSYWSTISAVGTVWFITLNDVSTSILRSGDDGLTWNSVTVPSGVWRTVVGIGTTFYLSSSDGAGSSVLMSTDSGLTWSSVTAIASFTTIAATESMFAFFPYDTGIPEGAVKAISQNLFCNGVRCSNGSYKLLGGGINEQNGFWQRTA